jgi:threonine dehydratase
MNLPGKEELSEIRKHLEPYIHKTPVITSGKLNEMAGAKLYFKCENFQKTGSFKIRGAMNAVLTLDENELRKGVITHSSGNFAQALAYAAQSKGIKATIVMPENVNPVKRDAVLGYGAHIVYSGNNPEDRESNCNELIAQTGASFIHPSNDINVIKGHSSCAAELIEQSPQLDFLFTPVGGGGLLSAMIIGFKTFSAASKIFAGEPANAADAYRSIRSHKIEPSINPDTIADGLKTSLGSVTFPIIEKYVNDIILVSEEEIVNAMRLIWERMKIVVEPSGAVSFAAVLKYSDKLKGKRTGIILSGGNVDLSRLPF